METHEQLVQSPKMNAEAVLWDDFDCPVIDPYDQTWCQNGPDFYPVPCKYILLKSNLFKSSNTHFQLIRQLPCLLQMFPNGPEHTFDSLHLQMQPC